VPPDLPPLFTCEVHSCRMTRQACLRRQQPQKLGRGTRETKRVPCPEDCEEGSETSRLAEVGELPDADFSELLDNDCDGEDNGGGEGGVPPVAPESPEASPSAGEVANLLETEPAGEDPPEATHDAPEVRTEPASDNDCDGGDDGRRCSECNKPFRFRSRDRRRRTCSTECSGVRRDRKRNEKRRAVARASREANPPPTHCSECPNELPQQTGGRQRLTCSKKCYRRRKARLAREARGKPPLAPRPPPDAPLPICAVQYPHKRCTNSVGVLSGGKRLKYCDECNADGSANRYRAWDYRRRKPDPRGQRYDKRGRPPKGSKPKPKAPPPKPAPPPRINYQFKLVELLRKAKPEDLDLGALPAWFVRACARYLDPR